MRKNNKVDIDILVDIAMRCNLNKLFLELLTLKQSSELYEFDN